MSRSQACRRRDGRAGTFRERRHSGTIDNRRIVLFRPPRGTLVVGNIRQRAFFRVAEIGAIFQVNGDGGLVVEGARSGLVRAGDLDPFVWSERAGRYAGDGGRG